MITGYQDNNLTEIPLTHQSGSVGSVFGSGELARHSRQNPCPICAGHSGLPKGQGVRCAGFSLDRVVYCTREQYAGCLPLDISTSPAAYKHALFGGCYCGTQHGWNALGWTNSPQGARQSTLLRKPTRYVLPIETRHEIYSAALELLPLREESLSDLKNRGLTKDVALSIGYRSLPRRGSESNAFLTALLAKFGEEILRKCPGFTDKNDRLTFWTAWDERDGYVVPYKDEHGRITGLQAKILGAKYLTAKGSVLSSVYHIAGKGNPGADLYVTEGATKANVANHLGSLWTFAVAGQSLTDDHVNVIKSLNPGRVIVALDQENNPNTERARERWLKNLHQAGLDVHTSIWEGSDLGGPKGLDDLVFAGGSPRIRAVHFVPSEIGQRRTSRPTNTEGSIDNGKPLKEVRALTWKTVQDFVTHHIRNKGKAQLLSTSPGAGKTTAVAKAVQNSSASIRIVVGTKTLASGLSNQFGYNLVNGRSPDNCRRIDVVDALAESGHDIGKHACGTPSKPLCPFRSECDYWKQFHRLGTRIGTTEQIYNPKFLEGGAVLVVDDAELQRALVERRQLNVEALSKAIEQLNGKRWEAARDIVDMVHHAVVDAPRREDGHAGGVLLGAAVWDHLSRTAKRYGKDVKELIEAIPEKQNLPKPKADDDGVVTVEAVQAVPPMAVRSLLEALIEELPSFLKGEDFNSRIRLGTSGIDIWRMRELPDVEDERRSLADMAMLVLDATPVDSFVDYLTQKHERLPDVKATVRIPENVRVVQYASSSNGHAALREKTAIDRVAAEVTTERRRYPTRTDEEAIICFQSQRKVMEDLGFQPEQILTYGSARGSNALSEVERLHIIGRPMPPGDDLVYLAQVLHHKEKPISDEILLNPRAYGGQRHEAEVVDFADDRVAELLRASREDEMTQVIHRARLVALDPQTSMDGFSQGEVPRSQVRLVLHTSHPVPGLRVDELISVSHYQDVNIAREAEAQERIIAAVGRLEAQGRAITTSAVAREAGAHKATVAKVLGTPVHTPSIDNLYRGMNHRPQSPTDEGERAIPTSPSSAHPNTIMAATIADSTTTSANACGDCGEGMWWQGTSDGWVCDFCGAGSDYRAPPESAEAAHG